MKGLFRTLLATIVLLTAGCGAGEDGGYAPQFSKRTAGQIPEYVFAPLPVQNPKRLFELYAPLVDYLNTRVRDARFHLQASRSFSEFEKNLYARRFDFALPNPYETVNVTRHGYRIFGKTSDDQLFRGVILVRRDSNIQQVQDLRGKTVSFPAPTALAGALMPQYYLHTHGLDVNRDIRMLYSGSHESSIMNVYLGNATAGAVWLPPWQTFSREKPDIARQLEVRWQTGTLPDNGLVVREGIPEAIIRQVGDILFSLHLDGEGRTILARIGVSRFEPASEGTYEPVRAFIRQFSTQVRPIGDIPG